MDPARRLEVELMLAGLKRSIRLVRDDIDGECDPLVTSRLWNAEMDLEKAIGLVRDSRRC